MAKTPKKEMVEIPIALAKLLSAKPEDYNDASKYDEVQEVAKALLRLLIE
jgi:hypothetical protein